MPPQPLHLDLQNCLLANRAVASVLLLYFHLLREGGITSDQTVYVNADDFDPFIYLTVEVSDQLTDVDQTLLREGAIIHLLCDLADVVGEHEEDYLKQPLTRRILSACADGHFAPVPEAVVIANMVAAGESHLNPQHLQSRLVQVYERYVVNRFRELLAL